MDSHNKRRERERLAKGFRIAFSGLWRAVLAERNLQIHFFAAIIVLSFAFVFDVSYVEKLILLIVIGVVIALELMNTAIERAVDLVSIEETPLAKLAKDIAASSVLFFTIIAVIIGLAIFIHHW